MRAEDSPLATFRGSVSVGAGVDVTAVERVSVLPVLHRRSVSVPALAVCGSSPSADLIAAYDGYMRRRGLTWGTREARRFALQSFVRWLEPQHLFDATRHDIDAYLDTRRGRTGGRAANRTRYGSISHLDNFYRWCEREEIVGSNPAHRVDRPRLAPNLPRPIRDTDLALALDKAPHPRLYAWVMLGAYAGFRCSDIGRLQVADVNYSGHSLRVLGKGNKERVVPLHDAVAAALQEVDMPRDGAVFQRPRKGAYPPHTVSTGLNQYLRRLGIDASAHSLRHWFATQMYALTRDLRVVQELLGHSSPATTAIYTKIVLDPATAAAVQRLDVQTHP